MNIKFTGTEAFAHLIDNGSATDYSEFEAEDQDLKDIARLIATEVEAIVLASLRSGENVAVTVNHERRA